MYLWWQVRAPADLPSSPTTFSDSARGSREAAAACVEVERDLEATNSCFRNSAHPIVRCRETGRIGGVPSRDPGPSLGDYSVWDMSNESCSSYHCIIAAMSQ
jgi:hypothetical protein